MEEPLCHVTDVAGGTPSSLAKYYGHNRIFRLLEEHGNCS